MPAFWEYTEEKYLSLSQGNITIPSFTAPLTCLSSQEEFIASSFSPQAFVHTSIIALNTLPCSSLFRCILLAGSKAAVSHSFFYLQAQQSSWLSECAEWKGMDSSRYITLNVITYPGFNCKYYILENPDWSIVTWLVLWLFKNLTFMENY